MKTKSLYDKYLVIYEEAEIRGSHILQPALEFASILLCFVGNTGNYEEHALRHNLQVYYIIKCRGIMHGKKKHQC